MSFNDSSTAKPIVCKIVDDHDEAVARWHRERGTSWRQTLDDGILPDGYDSEYLQMFFAVVAEQHASNYRLWHWEDRVRQQRHNDSIIATTKRAIDQENQIRNDLIEKVDERLIAAIGPDRVVTDASRPMNTETPGSAIDRLSVLSLRIYHYREIHNSEQVDLDLREVVQRRCDLCVLQRRDLIASLSDLTDDLAAGRKRYQMYRQLKMYNDRRFTDAAADRDSEATG